MSIDPLEAQFIKDAVTRGLLQAGEWEAAVAATDAELTTPMEHLGPGVHRLILDGRLEATEVARWAAQHKSEQDGAASTAGPGAPASSGGTVPAWVDRIREEGHPAGLIRHYELGRLLGRGGMGQVFLAYDPVLGREVALKLMLGSDPDMNARMLREARSQARIDHPNVCRIIEAGEWEGQTFIVMQFIRGKTLDALVAGLDRDELVRIFAEVCDGLHAAHRLGQVHRDIKPGNVMAELQEDGSWKPYLMDFGLVRDSLEPQLTGTGLIMGTPAFMSPEQARGDARNLDRRADIYSLGVSLYQALTGFLPFEGQGIDVLVKVINDEPPAPRSLLPDIPPDLETIVLRCLEKEPHRRYDSARALGDDLRRYLDGEPILARRLSRRERLLRWARKNRALAASALLSVLLLLTLGAYASWSTLQAKRQNALALVFGQMAERMESVIRTADLRPLHDTGVERKSVRDQMAVMRTLMADKGAFAQAPGRYALGRAHLALGELPQARAELQGAWDLGLRTPELSRALGRTLALTYLDELQEVTGKQRAAKEKALAPTLRDPAVRHLASGRSADTVTAALSEGLIAWMEGRSAEAISRAREARRGTPWNHEGWLLEGDVQLFETKRLYDTGEIAQARSHLEEAHRAYQEAVRVAPSSPASYAALARAYRWRLNLEIEEGRPYQTTLEAGLRACSNGAFADASDPAPRRLQGLLLLRWCDADTTLGATTRESLLKQAVDSIQAAAVISPDARHLGDLAWAYGLLAGHRDDAKEDPTEAASAGIAAGNACLALNPGNERGAYWLATCHYILGSTLDLAGERAVQHFNQAANLLEQLNLNNPRDQNFMLLGGVRGTLAANLEKRKMASGPMWQASLDAFQKAFELDPSQASPAIEWVATHQRFLIYRMEAALGSPADFVPEEPWMDRLRTLNSPVAPVLQLRREVIEARKMKDPLREAKFLKALQRETQSPNPDIRGLADKFFNAWDTSGKPRPKGG